MLFNSFDFLFFFLVVFALFIIGGRWRWLIMLIVSYFFYMAWKWEYIFLIMASTLVDYACARAMDHYTDNRIRKRFLILSIISNLGILFSFKYFNFFSGVVANLFSGDAFILNVLLPVGISFYTFQTLSYSVDVYHRKIPAEKHLGYFALYVSYFPQLVAGPIERAGHLLNQFKRNFSIHYDNLYSGAKLVLWGLFKKVVIADRLALLVDPVYAAPEDFHGLTLALATLFFGVQIYCDFSGYTDMAIGISRVFNVHLIKNFDRPYFSRSIGEFWNRWHISLSHWFRDYVYIPLGGNRVLKWRWTYNIMITFLLSGFWHGANWTFIVWGGLHGLYLLIERWMGVNRQNGGVLRVVITFFLVHLAWVFFRSDNVGDAMLILHTIFTAPGLSELHAELLSTGIGLLNLILSLGLITFLFLVEFFQRKDLPFALKLIFYLLLLFGIVLFGIDGADSFIYFQF